MLSLEDAHPSALKEFLDGNFVLHKTNHGNSPIAIDHAYEQHNKCECVKGDAGAFGLMGNSSQLLRCSIYIVIFQWIYKKEASAQKHQGDARLKPTTRVPTNWQELIRVDDSTTELCTYLADQ